MLNVSSFYFLVAIVKDFLAGAASVLTPQQWVWGAAGGAALFALLRIVLPPPRDDTRIDWPKRCQGLALACLTLLAGVLLYQHWGFLQEQLTQLAIRMGGSGRDVGISMLLGACGLVGLALFVVYLLSSRKPNDDSTLNQRQKSGFALLLLLCAAVLLAVRWFAYDQYADAMLTLFIAAEVVNLVFWFYDPLIYLASRLMRVHVRPSCPPTPGYLNRIAVIGCAHNEEAVIGKLIESIYKCAYPRNRYDVYVVCDNCTDGTAAAVLRAGGIPMVREDAEKRGKGYALSWIFAQLQEMRATTGLYDAYVILDADNVVNESFLESICNELNEGYDVLQAYLGCKNPGDTWISKAYSLGYWLSNVNYQDAHSRLGLSAQLGGTGMVFRPSMLDEVGWEPESLTEDLMMTTRYVRIRRQPCRWAHGARLYDEKPLSLRASIKQRTRWMQGHMDTALRYGLPTLLRGIVHMSWIEIDMAFYLLRPLLNFGMFWTFLLRWAIAIFSPSSPLNHAFLMTPAAATLLLVFYLLMQVHTLSREGYLRSVLWIPISYIYALTWYVPILRGLIKRNERCWVSTVHTRDLSIHEIKDDNALAEAIGRLSGIDNLHRMTLGQILLKSSTITSDQLYAALERQRREGGQLGEIIVNMQVVSKETLDTYLLLQQTLRDRVRDEEREEERPPERLRLGELLVDAGIITQAQLEGAMAHQRAVNCLLGESLVSTRAMSPEMLTTFLNIQRVLDEHYLTPQRALHLINGIMRERVSNLGMLLFAGGLISQYQLDVALAYQREHGGVIGEIIVELGFVSQEHINALLKIQESSRAHRTIRAAKEVAMK